MRGRFILCGVLLTASATLALLAHSSLGAQDAPKPAAKDAFASDPAKPKDAQPVAETPKNSEIDVVIKIDAMIEEKWKEKKLTPAKPASDSEWFRRVSIDTIGRAPSLDETTAFLANKSPSRRTETLKALLDSEEYAQNQGRLWRKALIGSSDEKKPGLYQLEAWLADAAASNMPYDKMTTALIAATGEMDSLDPTDAAAVAYLTTFENEINSIAGNVSRAFLGVEIQCAQCHDHFFEHWKQADYQGFAAIFRTTRTTRASNDPQNDRFRVFVIDDDEVEAPGPRRKKRMEERAKQDPKVKERVDLMSHDPKTLDGPVLEGETGLDLREKLAAWMTAKDNPFFARTAVNRVWAHYLKRGFAEPVDDFSTLNTPSNPELLAYLTKDFIESGYDLKRLTRIILGTRAYQLSSVTSANNANDVLWYSRGYVRQLSAEELLGSFMAATQVEKTLERAKLGEPQKIKRYLLRQFTTIFEDDEGKELESFTGTIPQALVMMNGDFMSAATAANPGGTLLDVLKDYKTADERVRALYLAAFSREPSANESRTFTKYIADEGGVVAAYEDVFWALCNSAEFLNNH